MNNRVSSFPLIETVDPVFNEKLRAFDKVIQVHH